MCKVGVTSQIETSFKFNSLFLVYNPYFSTEDVVGSNNPVTSKNSLIVRSVFLSVCVAIIIAVILITFAVLL